jgi:O-antigen ligase
MAWPAPTIIAKLIGRENLARHADWLAVAVAVSLPWSTSVSLIFIVLWLVMFLGSAHVAALRHEISTPAGGLPVAMWVLGAVGVLWAAAPLDERIAGLNSFHRLVAIPLLLAQFRRSDRGRWVLVGFLASCTILLVVSWGLFLFPDIPFGRRRVDIPVTPVKDYSSQSVMFTLCIFGLAESAFLAWRKARRRLAFALVLLALIFLANIFYVATSRTALVVIPILLLLFGFMRLGWRGVAAMLIATIVLAAAAWPSAPFMRERVTRFVEEVRNYEPGAMSTPAGERLDFWHKSVVVIADAPLFGHGTGSIRQQLRRSETGKMALATNPHNQTFAVAIQLGLAGTAVLFAMWIAHLRLFRGPGLLAGIGLAVVVQNVVGSLFNTSLFDFTSGWTYVWGVGVLGGMVLRASPSRTVDGHG